MVIQRKTKRPVQFELTEPTRNAIAAWLETAKLQAHDFLFSSRLHSPPHLSTRQYARIVDHWVASGDLDASAYGTHSMRRTKATLLYKRTKNLRPVQLLLGHAKLESTVRYLGIEVEMPWRFRSRSRSKTFTACRIRQERFGGQRVSVT